MNFKARWLMSLDSPSSLHKQFLFQVEPKRIFAPCLVVLFNIFINTTIRNYFSEGRRNGHDNLPRMESLSRLFTNTG